MTAETQVRGRDGFLLGLVTGTLVGVGLAWYLAPRTLQELRARLSESTGRARDDAAEHYQAASTRLGDAVDDLARKGRGIRRDVADTVARGARKVERFATAAKEDGDDATRPPL